MYTKRTPTTIISLVFVALAVLFLVSCKSGNKQSEMDQLAADSLDKEMLASNIREVLYPLPTPFEMTQMLTDIGATYTKKNLNAPDKVEKYITEQSKAINLGVYGADLAYASTYEQQQDIQVYMNTIKTLADQLGITYDYSYLLEEGNKARFENKDTVISIVTNTIYNAYQYLNQKSNPDLAVNMVTGMWIELMYLATNISEDSYNFTGMVDIISEQKASYDQVMILLASRNTDPEIKELETKLQVLKPVYDKVATGLSEADYSLILKTIKSVRNSLV